MMLVDYAGSIFPIISHSPWDGIHLADFVMPFFLFVAGISPALVYKVLIEFLTNKVIFFPSSFCLIIVCFLFAISEGTQQSRRYKEGGG